MSFTYSFYREKDRGNRQSFAYWHPYGSNDWLWRLADTGDAVIEGFGYPAWITAKAKLIIPRLLAESASGSKLDVLSIRGDLTQFDDEELIEIEAWDQS